MALSKAAKERIQENIRKKKQGQISETSGYSSDFQSQAQSERDRLKNALSNQSAAREDTQEQKRGRNSIFSDGFDITKNREQGQAGYDRYEAQRSDVAWYEHLRGYLGPQDTSLPSVYTQFISENYRDYDDAMRAPDARWSEDEKLNFGYLWDQDAQKAREYAFAVNEQLNAQQERAQREDVQKWAAENPHAATAGALLGSQFGLGDYLGDAIAYSTLGYVPKSDGMVSPLEASQEVTGSLSKKLNEEHGTLDESIPIFGGKGLGDVYGLGTSILQSGLAGATGSQAYTLASFFGSAAAGGINHALERGASSGQALLVGTVEGAAEAVAEMIGVDNLLNIGSSHTLKEFFLNVMKQGAAEGIEEGITSIVNNVADNFIMQDKSDFYANVQNYMDSGMTEQDAKKKAWLDAVEGIAFDVVGGAVSGVVHGAPATAVNTVKGNAYAAVNYSDSASQLVQRASEAADGSKAQILAQEYGAKLEGGDSLSGNELSQLAEAVYEMNRADIEQMATEQLQERGEKNPEHMAKVITMEVAGEQLSAIEEMQLSRSEYAQEIADGLRAEYESLSERSGLTAREAQEQNAETPAQEQNAAQEGAQETQSEQTAIYQAQTVSDLESVAAQTAVEESSDAPKTVTLEEASQKYGAQAKAMQAVYNLGGGTQDVAQFDGAYGKVYNYAYSGTLDVQNVKKLPSINAYMTEQQIENAYRIGTDAADAQARELDAQNKAQETTGTVRRMGEVRAATKKELRRVLGGNVKGVGMTTKDLSDTLNDPQKKAYGVLSTVAKVTGIDIVLYKSSANEKGVFEGDTGAFNRADPGKIYIDLNAGLLSQMDVSELGQYAMLRTFAHEFTHFIEKWNPVQYNELRKVVFDTMRQNGADADALIQVQMESGLSYDAASREVVAEALTDILPDANFVQKLHDNHKNVFNTLLDSLKDFLDDLKAYFKGINPNKDKGAASLKKQVGDSIRYVDNIVKLFDNVAVQAVENYQRTVMGEQVEVAEAERAAEEVQAEPAEQSVPEMEQAIPKTEQAVPEMEQNPLEAEKVAASGEGSESGAEETAMPSMEEVTDNGEESGTGTDTPAVHEPVLRGEGAARLLEGVEPETVQRGESGREPVRSGEREGAADAGRDRRADPERSAGERGEGDRLGGDLQQLPELKQPETLHEEVAEQIEQMSTTEPKGSNYVIGDSLNLPNGTKARVRANMDAIKLVRQLEAENRFATAQEQEVLSKYVGWGGLADAFGKAVSNRETRKLEYQSISGMESEFEELKQILTEDEYKAARESTKNAHYTDISVIKAMYDGLKHFGFAGGRMLEPSSGTGNFVGAMPPDMSATVKSWTMVELDRITGLIAKHLYPHADVRIQGFEQSNIPDNYMDVAIGNVPFGNYGVTDKHYPKQITGSIHNYFFAKSLDKVRPGGLVMFITSSYTMNGRDNAVRKYIMQRADLIGAIRLPNNAFKSNAGTEVVTDILILKKRADKTTYAGEAFESAMWQRFDGGGAYVNEYFGNHSDMVLGQPKITRGMYSSSELTYEPLQGRGTLAEQIREAMSRISVKMEYTTQTSPEKSNFRQANAKRKAQRLQVTDGVIQQRDENGNLTKLDVDADTAARITGMVAIRDAHSALCDALQQGVKKQEITKLRKALNKAYDDFTAKYGYLNAPKNKKAINSFSDRYTILSLENYSQEKGKAATATKTDIFSKDTISANRTAESAENVEEGLTISLNATGNVDVSMIARLTGQKTEDVQRQLIDQRLVFKDRNGNLIPAVQYLSGNVRAKLREMEGLVGIDKDYQNNVDALRAVVPPTTSYTDIYVNPGANWVPTSAYENFVAYILERRNYTNYRGVKQFSVAYVPETNEYKVEINDSYAKMSAQNTQVWGESGKSFSTIFENMLNGRRTNVYMEDASGNRVIDRVKTEAVAEKAEKLSEEFRKWLWSDESRRSEFEELYNETYNALATPKYSGANLTINGLNSTYTLRPHQADAVSRIINSGGNTLLAHRVGAGKTLEMAAAAMKLKQLGIVKKPMFVVPNNVVAQWGKEFKEYFPAANILLVGDEDMTPAERMTTINKIKNNDYDAVILAYTKFEKIQMTTQWRQKFYEEQIDGILFAINAEKEAQRGKGFTVKQLEAKRKQLENRLKKLTEKEKDEDGAMFEDLGVDSLFVDEAHNFKNLEYSTRMNNVSGLGKADGSQRAFDLYTKVRYLQQLNGGRGIVFATATPVMNSMTEMYIMQRYLQQDTLTQLGIDNFDAWAKMFGEVVNALEIAPSGSGYRVKQTFSRFKNIKALQQLFRSFTDVVTEIPGLKIPKMKGGKVQIVECQPGEFQKNYMEELAKRADNVRNVDPSEDNLLKITSDGRKIAYSQRMIDPSLPYEERGKIYRCCENVFKVWQESAAIRGTQMIFCDMATPKGKAVSKSATDASADEFEAMDVQSVQLYDDMKSRLVALGIPANEIAFIHDAKNDKQKAELSEKMNSGKIRVLIGSTGKMGVGLNAQVKAVAIHHLDAPWRPGDIEQRDGRVFRQKNENKEAYKFVYVTKGSFDSRLWDILERKQKFINQIMNGEDVGNEVEDTGEVTLSAAEVKAVASGNPLIAEQVALEKEISKLESLQKAHSAGVAKAVQKTAEDERKIALLESLIGNVKEDIGKRKNSYTDKNFSIRIGKQTFTDKKDAGAALIAQANTQIVSGEYTQIGSFAGFALRTVKTSEGIKGYVTGAGNYEFKLYPLNPTYGINHLASVVEGLDNKLKTWETSLAEAKSDLAMQKKLATETFSLADTLKKKRARHNEIMDILNPPVEQTNVDEVVQHQKRTAPMSSRYVLSVAANDVRIDDLTDAERDALQIFRNRLTKQDELEQQRAELGQKYRQQQFGKGTVDREAAEKTRERMKEMDQQIEQARKDVLKVEETEVLRRVLEKARKVVEAAEREHGNELLRRYRDRRSNSAQIKKYKERIKKDYGELTKWLLQPDGKNAMKHIPDALKESVVPFLSSIDFMSKRSIGGGEATKADQKFIKQLEAVKAAIGRAAGDDYSGYYDLPANFTERLESFRNTAQSLLNNGSEQYIINQMTAEELRELSGIVRTLKKFITEFNKFHVNAMFQHVYEAGDNTISVLDDMKSAGSRTGTVSNFVLWQQLRPAYAWERFGQGGTAIYDGLRRGQATLAFDTKKIVEFSEKAYTEAEVKAWENKILRVELEDGIVRMPVSVAMSFYELSKREQALGHILGNGIRVATYSRDGKKISDSGHLMTAEDVNAIAGLLTDRQKEVADKLQQFMQEQGGTWGNHVSLKRFGEKLFGEEHYFPINSDGRYLPSTADEHPQAASLYALLNMGFTKNTTEGANNRIVLYSIFDVFANHMASMAQYHSFALPVVDAIKWFNYQQKSEPDENGKRQTIGSVRDQMDRVYGVPEETRPGSGRQGYAQSFVLNILRAFNGTEAQGSPMDAFGMKSLRTYNMAQIAYNFRVVMQQPLAITRAALLLDGNSIFRGMKLNPTQVQRNMEEMERYSGIAAWKSLGFYDVNISRGLTELIKHDATWRDKANEFGMKGAEFADKLTWAGIWSACKEEARRKRGLKPKDAGYYEAVTELFEDVVYKTQVVDSVLTKNEFMRSKGFFPRAIGSFMSEPTTTASMLIDAYDKYHADLQRGMTRQQAWKKNRRNIAHVSAVYGVGALMLAAVQAVADAWRDDDDYQDFLEKWQEAFEGNLIDELMPLNKLPILSDFYDLGKELASIFGVDTYGNPPQSVFMQWYDSMIKGTQILYDKFSGEETKYTWYGGIYKLLQAVSGMTGLPMAAATREIVSAWNNTIGAMAPSLKVKTYDAGDKQEVKYAYMDGYLSTQEAADALGKQGLSTEDAADQAEYWKFRKENPRSELSEKAALVWERTLRSSGVSLEDFETAWKTCQSFDAKDENGETVSGLKKERVSKYLDSLDVPNTRLIKKAIMMLMGYKENK